MPPSFWYTIVAMPTASANLRAQILAHGGRGASLDSSKKSDTIQVIPPATRGIPRLTQRCNALADEARVEIVARLLDGEKCVCDLTDALGTGQSRLSYHLKVLKDAGLVTDRLLLTASFLLPDPSTFLAQLEDPPMSSTTQNHGTATDLTDLRSTVQARYGEAARRVTEGGAASCCGPATESSGCCGSTTESWDPITANLYDEGEAAGVPAEALLASLGCGNPTALADLRVGDVVLDLGSGGGIDVLLSAKRVGPTGKAYGLDMTDDMLALANENKARAGATNVEFLRGHIEEIPLPGNTVDVIISNCVINLSGDKRKVLADAFRVLKPGGRFAVSDVIVRGGLPEAVKANMPLWTGCVAGALEEQEFLDLLTAVGFENPSIEPTRVYTHEDAVTLLEGTGLDLSLADEVQGRIMSGFVRATKPGGTSPRKPLVPLVSPGTRPTATTETTAASSTRACGCDAVPPDVQGTAEFQGASPASAVVMARPLTAKPLASTPAVV